MRNYLHFVLLFVTLFLSACATTKAVNSVADIKVTESTNIVLLGYDIKLIDENIRAVGFHCLDKQKDKKINCFSIPVKAGLLGISGSQVYQMDFGEYQLGDLVYSKDRGTRPEHRCHKQSNGKYKCTINQVPQFEDVVVATGFKHDFTVTPDKGVYLGHVQVHAQPLSKDDKGKREINANVTQQFDKDLIRTNDIDFIVALKKHIKQ